ncbi:MAG: LON peptidase substrate-binding domain-containing protein [Candidatus Nanopelagicales bacterium]
MSFTLPLFPLNTVMVPGLVLPLHIFEPRYRMMVRELLEIADEESREFGIVATKDGKSIEQSGLDALHLVGTATVLRQADETPDGRFDIVTTGSRRFRIESLDASQPLLRAEVNWLEDIEESHTPELELLTNRAVADFVSYRAALSGQLEETIASVNDMPEDPGVVSFLLTAAVVLPTAQRQEMLSAMSPSERLTLARKFLKQETSMITTFHSIPALDLFSPEPSAN